MPNFQTPTGISYSLEKKRKLLELAYQYDMYIIEEDNQNDFYYTGKKPVPLKALDYRSRVIYIKSFSKVLMPGLRMGFMALPKKLAVTTVKRNTDIATSGYIQRALDVYMRGGGMEAHGRFIRAVYGKRYKTALGALIKHLSPYIHFWAPGGGLSLWAELTHTRWAQSAEKFCAAVLEQQVILTPGSIFSDTADNAFRISFAAVDEERIAKGIEIIASVLE
jgi:DNA-binding transcriptional MocR family regulator